MLCLMAIAGSFCLVNFSLSWACLCQPPAPLASRAESSVSQTYTNIAAGLLMLFVPTPVGMLRIRVSFWDTNQVSDAHSWFHLIVAHHPWNNACEKRDAWLSFLSGAYLPPNISDNVTIVSHRISRFIFWCISYHFLSRTPYHASYGLCTILNSLKRQVLRILWQPHRRSASPALQCRSMPMRCPRPASLPMPPVGGKGKFSG